MAAPVAVTGGSGFIGRVVVRRLVEAGWPVRVLSRRHDPELEEIGAAAVRGSLEDESSLQRLVAGVVAVVHCAGLVAAPDAATFLRVNQAGSARLFAAAAETSARPRVLLLSSLAAREPTLSAYARSKRAGEEALWRIAADRGIDACALRPPAVYGPGDRATLPIFRQLRSGILLAPAVREARFSLLFVHDLAEAVLHLLTIPRWRPSALELDDGHEGGYRWRDLAGIAGRQLGRRIRVVEVPRLILWPFAALGGLAGAALRRPPRVSTDKLRELFHADWVARRVPDSDLQGWSPRTTFEQGVEETMAWYRQRQWL